MDETENGYQPTTREQSVQLSQSQKPKMSLREMATELERLAIHFPRPDMNEQKWKVLFQTFYEDTKNLTLRELQDGCRRWRTSGERFFPTPGQLIEKCRNPYEMGSQRNYPELKPLPRISREEAASIIDRTKEKYGLDYIGIRDREMELAIMRRDVLARKPIEMTPELIEREKALADVRLKALRARQREGVG